MFERFSTSTRQALAVAQEEAQSLGHDEIAGEHLLIGVLRIDEHLAGRCARRGITVQSVREALEAGTARDGGEAPFSADAKQALEIALRTAVGRGSQRITTVTSCDRTRCPAGRRRRPPARAGTPTDRRAGHPGAGARGHRSREAVEVTRAEALRDEARKLRDELDGRR